MRRLCGFNIWDIGICSQMYDGVVMGLRIDLKGRDDQLSLLKAHIDQPQMQLPSSQQRYHSDMSHAPSPTRVAVNNGRPKPSELAAASPVREASFQVMLPQQRPDLHHTSSVNDLLDAIKKGKAVTARTDATAGPWSPPGATGTSGTHRHHGGSAQRRVGFESLDVEPSDVSDQGGAAGLAAAAMPVGRFKDETGKFSFFGPSDTAISTLIKQIATGSPSSRSSSTDDEHVGVGGDPETSDPSYARLPSVLGQMRRDTMPSTIAVSDGSSALGLLLRVAAMEESNLSVSSQQFVPLGGEDWREALGNASRDLIREAI